MSVLSETTQLLFLNALILLHMIFSRLLIIDAVNIVFILFKKMELPMEFSIFYFRHALHLFFNQKKTAEGHRI